MDDYLSIQKIWQDTDFAEFEITGSSPVITAKTAVYMTDSLIDELFRQITRFLSGEVEERCWANKERGDNSTACLSLRFLRKDRLGHVLAEVYMELDDGGEFSDHNCCFYINTEYGLLQRFRDQLPKLKQPELFSVVRLNERL